MLRQYIHAGRVAKQKMFIIGGHPIIPRVKQNNEFN